MDRVLLARFHSLGDVILTTGLVVRLNEGGWNVEVVTSPRYVPVFEGLPVARIWTQQDLHEAGDFRDVLDLQANGSSRVLLRPHGPLRRLRSRSFGRRWIVFWGNREPRPAIPHAVERYAEAAGLRIEKPELLRPRLVVTEADLAEARRLPLAWAATEGHCVGLVEGASRRMKRWPGSRFAALAVQLTERGLHCLRFLEPPGGQSSEGPGFVRATLRPLKALLARCATVVSNDSGVMHLASALGAPVVGIFGSTVPEFGFRPLGGRDQVVQKELECRPCAVHGARFCWQLHARCLRDASVEEVSLAVFRVMETMETVER